MKNTEKCEKITKKVTKYLKNEIITKKSEILREGKVKKEIWRT